MPLLGPCNQLVVAQVALHVISSLAPPVHPTAAHVQTAGEKPTTYVDERGIDNTAVAVPLSTDGLLTGSCPWPVSVLLVSRKLSAEDHVDLSAS